MPGRLRRLAALAPHAYRNHSPHLRAQCVFLSSGSRGGGGGGDWEEFAGYRISHRFIEQIAAVALLSKRTTAPRDVHVIHCACAPKNRPAAEAFVENLREDGVSAAFIEAPSAPFWCGFTKGGSEEIVKATCRWARAVSVGKGE